MTFDQWQAECEWRGLVDKGGPGNRRRALMWKYRAELIACNWVKSEEDAVWSIRRE